MRLSKRNLIKALEAMSDSADLFVPVKTEGVSKFTAWKQGDGQPDLDLVNTTLPPKDILFPHTEKMYRFHASGSSASVEEVVEEPKQILFGIRPCDVFSIDCMDKAFLTKGYTDEFYRRKRENLTLVSIGCTASAATCFCSSMGIDCGEAPLADLFLAPAGDGWNVSVQTENGRRMAEILKALLEEEGGTPEAKAVCSLETDMTGVPEKLEKMFDHPVWDEIFRPCLGCGTCTYLCPTCYCFDINSEKSGTEGTQFRCWDSCMFSEYTRMAGGHNPRPSKKERVRNRYMHKLTYFKDRYGQNLCVGCGRCLMKCPVGMDITRIIDMVREAELDGQS